MMVPLKPTHLLLEAGREKINKSEHYITEKRAHNHS